METRICAAQPEKIRKKKKKRTKIDKQMGAQAHPKIMLDDTRRLALPCHSVFR